MFLVDMDLLFESIFQRIFRNFQIITTLEVKPELC